MSLRVAFLGNDPWSVASLEAIDEDPALEVAVALTNPPRPAGRGGALRPTAVATAARASGLPLVEAEGARAGSGAAALRHARPDVLVVVAYGELLRPAELELARFGAVNLHFSLLPRWRGAAPVQRALMAGDESTGVTVIRMDEGLDTGPIVRQREEPILAEDDAGSLGARLAAIGATELVSVLRALAGGDMTAHPQSDAGVTVAPRIGPDERVIDWRVEAPAIVRLVRGLAPEPGATTAFRDQPLKVLGAGVGDDASAAAPGTIVGAGEDGVLVAAGTGSVRLLTVAPAGRKRMNAAAWARGARFGTDERLG